MPRPLLDSELSERARKQLGFKLAESFLRTREAPLPRRRSRADEWRRDPRRDKDLDRLAVLDAPSFFVEG